MIKNKNSNKNSKKFKLILILLLCLSLSFYLVLTNLKLINSNSKNFENSTNNLTNIKETMKLNSNVSNVTNLRPTEKTFLNILNSVEEGKEYINNYNEIKISRLEKFNPNNLDLSNNKYPKLYENLPNKNLYRVDFSSELADYSLISIIDLENKTIINIYKFHILN